MSATLVRDSAAKTVTLTVTGTFDLGTGNDTLYDYVRDASNGDVWQPGDSIFVSGSTSDRADTVIQNFSFNKSNDDAASDAAYAAAAGPLAAAYSTPATHAELRAASIAGAAAGTAQSNIPRLHVQNCTLSTDTIDGFCIRSNYIRVTLDNVIIQGYSGATYTEENNSLISDFTNAAPAGSRWLEKAGGALRIQRADYRGLGDSAIAQNQQGTVPHIHNVLIRNCCRGLRPQNCIGMVAENVTVFNISDNALYAAVDSGAPYLGCVDVVFRECSTELSGQSGMLNINSYDTVFLRCAVQTSRASGIAMYGGSALVEDCVFTNNNTNFPQGAANWKTPFNGGQDMFGGATAGVSYNYDVNTALTVRTTTFVSGHYVYQAGANTVLNAISNSIIVGQFDGVNTPGSVQANIVVTTVSDVASGGDPYVNTLNGKLYKLDNINGVCRMLQGIVEGKSFVLNAMMKLDSREQESEMNSWADENSKGVEKSNLEMQSFYTKLYMKHGDDECIVDLETGNVQATENTSIALAKLGPKTALLPMYNLETSLGGCSMSVGGVTVTCNLYNNKQLRNEIGITGAENIKNADGFAIRPMRTKVCRVKKLTDASMLKMKESSFKSSTTERFYSEQNKQGLTKTIGRV